MESWKPRRENKKYEILQHANDGCTGNWRLLGPLETRQIKCDKCGIEYKPTTNTWFAMIDENTAGRYLKRLTKEGQAIQEKEKGEENK